MADHPPEIFVSYKWGGESEKTVDQIEASLTARGIRLIRDKRHLPYRGSVREFMRRIGQGRAVVVVLSDDYLKSKNCMFELLEIFEQRSVSERIFPVVLGDAHIYDSVKRHRHYILHWEERKKELEDQMRRGGLENISGIARDLDLYAKIRATLDSITDVLQDMNTLTPEIHRDRDFDDLVQGLLRVFPELTVCAEERLPGDARRALVDDDLTLIADYAEYLLDANDLACARRFCERILDLDAGVAHAPDVARAHELLGRIALRTGEELEATVSWEQSRDGYRRLGRGDDARRVEGLLASLREDRHSSDSA